MKCDLSHSDVSGVIRLVCEVCDRWDDPAEWREHLLRGACGLLDGNVGMMISDAGSREGYFGRPGVISAVGVAAEKQRLMPTAMADFEDRGYADVSANVMPGMTRLYGQIVKQGWVTATRSEVSDVRAYHASPHYLNFRRQLDCDDYVISIRIVDQPRRPEGISVNRPHGAKRFGEREVAILKLLHDEIAPLVGVRLATEEHLCRDGLSRRLRETLSLLLEGKSEKEAAGELKLGARTVHEYVTMLYEHFRVSSRAELLAYFVKKRPVKRMKDEG